MRMRKITKEMLKIYKPISNLDWLNYTIVRKEDMTYHHIVKKSEGGNQTIENGALLMPISHQYLHLIEYIDLDTYVFINKMFEIINKQRYEPTNEQRDILEYILTDFENKNRWKKGSNGKVLIKYPYLKRGWK